MNSKLIFKCLFQAAVWCWCGTAAWAQEEADKPADATAVWRQASGLLKQNKVGEAMEPLRKAAELGEVEAQEKLAEILLSGARSGWPEGLSWLDRAVQGGAVRAMEIKAEILLTGGFGLERSPARAKELVEKAREKPGATDAYFLLGKMMAEGIGVEPDAALALAHLRKGVEVGSLKAMVTLHDLYLNGRIVERDVKEAEKFALKAWELGSADAGYKLGLLYEKVVEGAPKWPEALAWYEKAREKGHPGATTRLGGCSLQGLGQEADASKAYKLFCEAAEKGDGQAAYSIAMMYKQGEGLPEDLVASAGWLRVSAETGYVLGQNEYGVRLLNGGGVYPDAVEAAKWFEKACNSGYPPAFVNLGDLYMMGRGVVKDPVKGLRMYEIAARRGYGEAFKRLALMHKEGRAYGGVPDPVGAAYWAQKAAAVDESYAETAAKYLEALDKGQKEELERRVSDAAGTEE